MASYDSDSGSEDGSFTETNVLLGYATKDTTDDTTSQLGGYPTWLDEKTAPPGDFAKCKNCNELMTLLLQLNGDLPERFPSHERRLYIFACKRKACRRKDGSVRGFRAIRPSTVQEPEQKQPPKKEAAPEPVQSAPRTNIGQSLFGVSKPNASTGSSNPFSLGGGASAAPSNPFAAKPTSAATPAPAPAPAPSPAPSTETPTLSETFATKARISDPTPSTPVGPSTPWPAQSSFPPPYPTYNLDADYETLDNTTPSIPQNTRVDMDIDNPSGTSGTTTTTSDADEQASYESTMDTTFQKFADRMSQNPEQVLRYEFGGVPLLYSKTDAIGRILALTQDTTSNVKVKQRTAMPRCAVCGAERLFELQLTPYAISELEADELGLEGMEWGTVILGVCAKDCVPRGTKVQEVGYVEEWVGVQWEELGAKK